MRPAGGGTAFRIDLHFDSGLAFFLSKQDRATALTRILREKTSIKDAIEACGVPHPEVDLVQSNGAIVPFEHQLQADAVVHVYGVVGSPATAEAHLQQRRVARFVVDGHLGRLVRDLPFLGFDVVYQTDPPDDLLIAVAAAEDRALVTRNRRLLMWRAVRHGYCPRSHDPGEQMVEVLRRFDLAEVIAPFTRCPACNAMLRPVEKRDILEQLEPLTRIHYDESDGALTVERSIGPDPTSANWKRGSKESEVGCSGAAARRMRTQRWAIRNEAAGPDWARTSDPALIKRML